MNPGVRHGSFVTLERADSDDPSRSSDSDDSDPKPWSLTIKSLVGYLWSLRRYRGGHLTFMFPIEAGGSIGCKCHLPMTSVPPGTQGA